MEQSPDLESLYHEAREALAEKEFERASVLLKQILLVDENYRDASKLLAGLVKQQRRRWYQSRLLWIIVGVIAIIALGIFLVSKLPAQPSSPTQPLMVLTSTPIPASQTPTSTLTVASPTPSATPTSIPLVWERLWIGQELARDGITTIVIDPADPDILYVGTENAGIYKSIDGGLSWKPMQNGLGRAWVISLVIDPIDPRILYAGVSTGGVYKTTDGGENWSAVNNGIDNFGWDKAASLAMDPHDGQHLLFTAKNGLFETRNGGKEWARIEDKREISQCFLNVKFHPMDSQMIFAILAFSPTADPSCPGGIFKSEDGGLTWKGIGLSGIRMIDVLHQTFAIDQQSGNLLYVATEEGIFGSRDGGGTWEKLSEELCSSIAVSPDDGNVVYCGAERILITNDGGITWKSDEKNVPFIGQIAVLAVSPQNAQVLVIGGQGVFASNDAGETWEESNNGLGVGSLELILDALKPSTLYLDQKGSGFLYRSTDNGRSWAFLYRGAWDLALDSSGEILYRLAWDQGLLRSADQGVSWETVPWPMDEGINSIAAHPKLSHWVYVTYGREHPPYVFLSKDGGSTWEGSQGMESIFDGRLYFDHDQGNVVYVIGDVDAFRSGDNGETWKRCKGADAWHSRSYSRLAINPRDSNRLILATRGKGISMSVDGCQSWKSSNDGLGSMFINTVAYDPNNSDILYAGGDSGAYISFDGGEHWGEINEGLLGATVVYSIVVDPSDPSNVYAATPYGIFMLEER